jgi:hypothetical protein
VGERLIYGPFPPAKDPAQVMQDVSGYVPVQGRHTASSEHCASCHTLYTRYVDAEGEIAGTFPDQVQIYETILENIVGDVTTRLLAAKGYAKDNRLLPVGFDKVVAGEDIAVHGGALDDEDFEGGGDTTRYAIALDGAPQPLNVTVELLYQAISYRWAENLRAYDAAEVNRFLGYYDAVPNEPVVMDTATISVGR